MTAPERPLDAPFEEPWQAQLFALTLALNEAGLFSWTEWSATFGPRVTDAPTEDYWHHWTDALTDLLVRKDVTSSVAVSELAGRWQDAARATPHGSAITLDRSGAG